MYIGKEASADGTIILARSSDTQDNYLTRVMVVPRIEQYPDRKMPMNNDRSTFYIFPVTICKYPGTPFMVSALPENGTGMDNAVCVNEYGVGMAMSATAFSNSPI